jgi:pimeloyl-ACP methyl ester carboxylesterase
MLARIRAGEDSLAVTRGMYDDQRPGTFDSFPEWRRQILVDNARTMGPVLTRGASDYPFTCPDAAAMRMPVLIVVGARTSAAMRQIASLLLECLPDSRRAVLPDATHTIQFDAPETMARVVADFLAR